MKITYPLTLTEGYNAPNTEHATSDIAKLDSQDFWHVKSIDFQFTLPDKIMVQAQAEPVPLKTRAAHVSLLSQGKALPSQALYDPATLSHHFTYDPEDCQMQAIRLKYYGSEWQNLLPFTPNDLIYEKPFRIQDNRIIHEEHTQDESPIRRLYGYGGVYKAGLPPNQIQQVYSELFEGVNKTEITLTSSSQWQERGVIPFNKGTFQQQQILVEPELTYEQSLNLGAALTEGYAKVKVQDPTTQDAFIYTSSGVTQPHESPHILLITFTKQQGGKL